MNQLTAICLKNNITSKLRILNRAMILQLQQLHNHNINL